MHAITTTEAGCAAPCRIRVDPWRVFLKIISGTVMAFVPAACDETAPVTAPSDPRNDVTIVVSATATEPRPALTGAVARILRNAAESRDATDGPDGRGSSARVRAAAAGYAATFPLTPRREDGAVERGLHRGSLINRNLGRVSAAIEGVQARQVGMDLLTAMDDATRGTAPGTLIVMSHGLSTSGGFDLRRVGWNADPVRISTVLHDRGLLPALAGWRVTFTGLGATAGAQPPLPRPTRLKLIAYWTAICTAAGGDCDIDDAGLAPAPAATTVPMPIVPVPGLESVTGPRGQVTYNISDTLLGFAGDSADLPAAAVDYLNAVATRIGLRLRDQPGAAVTVIGFCADPPGSTPEGLRRLSRARAGNVADAIRRSGVVHNPIVIVGAGVAPGGSAVRDGHFDEARAAQMRRVQITF